MRRASEPDSGARAVALPVAILLASAFAFIPVAAAESLLQVQVSAPLVPNLEIDVNAKGGPLVDVEVESPFLPPLLVELPGVKLGKDQARPQEAPPPPPPAGTKPSLPEATGIAAGKAAGAATLGVALVAPVLPWEAAWNAVSHWFNQAREAARPVLRPVGRILRAVPFLLPLFARINGERLLENPVRARVHEAIHKDPGISLQDVRDRAGIAWGTTVHHLNRLERHGFVVSVRHGNHRRFFPSNTQASRHRRELTALSHPTAHRIAVHVRSTPGTDQKGLCEALDIRNPAASKHLTRFERLGLVQSEVVGRSKMYHPTDLLMAVLSTLESLGGLSPDAEARTERRESTAREPTPRPERPPLRSEAERVLRESLAN
jgi:DNA-binding MarR family transcriptional regulator